MSAGALLAVNAGVIISYMTLMWAVGVRIGDVSFIDAAWGLGSWSSRRFSFGLTDGDQTRRALILAVTAVWGLRLGAYPFWR